MSVRRIKAGTTDVSVVIRIIDSTDGTPETAVEHDSAGIDLWYRREGAISVDITEAALTALTDAHSDGGLEPINDGWYRLDLPDAACAAGATGVQIGGTVTGMVVLAPYIELVAYDPQDAVRLGLTALPNAAADAAGGLPISDAGGLDLDAILADTNELQTDWANGGRLDLIVDATLADTNEVQLKLAGTGAVTLASLTVDGATTLTGNVALAAGLTITQSTLNAAGVSITGNGNSVGMEVVGGSTGIGMWVRTGAGVSNNPGLLVVGAGTGSGLQATGGATGHGIYALGGVTSGDGIHAHAQASTSSGISAEAHGTGVGFLADAMTVTNALTAGTNAIPWNAAWDTEVQSEVTDALNAYDPPTNAEMEARTLVAASYATPTNITAGTITTVTNLTNAPTAGDLTATMKASVNTEIDTALADIHLDHLFATAAAGTEAANSSYWSRLVSKSATPAFSSYDNTTDSLEAVRDRGDAAWVTATGFSTLDAAGVRTAVGLAAANLDTQLGDIPTNSELATAIITGLTTALTEGYRGTGATGSVRDLLYEVIAHLGESAIASTTKTLKKLDGSTTAKTYTLNDASTPTSITETT